jgi:predicted HicB family RNase H-like nuclease
MTTMRCGDYLATIDFEEESRLFHGRVVNIRDVVNFYGGSAEELLTEFQRSVEEYQAVCREEGIAPGKPYSGRFNVRLAPELHRAVAEASAQEGKSLNAWVAEELAQAVGRARPARTGMRSGRAARSTKRRAAPRRTS